MQELIASISGESGAFVPQDELTDKLTTVMVELAELRSELAFLQNDSSEPGGPDALVGARVKPPRPLNPGR